MTTTASLRDRVAAVVIADPDVRAVYPAFPARAAAGRIAAQLVTASGDGQGGSSAVTISQSPDGTTISVAVGVAGREPAIVVCRRLHDAIAAELSAADADAGADADGGADAEAGTDADADAPAPSPSPSPSPSPVTIAVKVASIG